MSELLATIQNAILFFGSNTRNGKGVLRDRTFYRVIKRNLLAREELKILIPYSSKELLCPLLVENHVLECVYLDAKRLRVKKQLMGKENKRDRISFLENDLRSFRAKADFDLVFCALPQIGTETDRLLVDLCHCRMLLKPGGQLYLYVENHKEGSIMERLGLQRGVVAKMLLRSGFNNTVERRLSHGQIFCSGQRPSYTF
ncbi:MAG: hypothetical protein JRJ37_06500 [Deltaproteobacteria bacterium]|nr:hypothetical protein [Deltaproteobacteria bacterium]